MRPRLRAVRAPLAVAADRRSESVAGVPRPLQPLTAHPDGPPLGALAIGLVALALYVASPLRERFFATPIEILSFALPPLLFPSIRARLDTPICPINWALLVFLFQLVVDPL